MSGAKNILGAKPILSTMNIFGTGGAISARATTIWLLVTHQSVAAKKLNILSTRNGWESVSSAKNIHGAED
jgi:hypothetical protein